MTPTRRATTASEPVVRPLPEFAGDAAIANPSAPPTAPPTSARSMTARRSRGRTAIVRLVQFAIIAVILVSWEFVPQIPGITDVFPFMDPFFISSPTRIGTQLYYLATGTLGSAQIWGPFADTILTALSGTAVGLAVGAIGGIAVSNWSMLADITRPFLVVVNAVPKVAIIPIIILLVHEARLAAAVTAFIAVFFLAFYNAAEGASSVPREMIQNAELLGASKVRVMLRVRSPYAIGWTLAALPNAIAWGLTATVTAEIITGGSGLGYQLLLATNYANASLLFSIVIIVSVVGVALVLGATALRKVLLPWWESSEGA